MDIEEILAELRDNRGRFPRKALVAAIERPADVTPHLIESIEYARRQADGLPPEFIQHVFAMYLLAQFRERAAYAPILDYLSLPGRLALDLAGDVVTEDMHRILAAVAHGEIEPMLSLVDRPEIDEYVRGAILQGVVASHLAGEVSRERLCRWIDELFEGRLERRPSSVWPTLVITCAELSLEQFRPQVERAFDAGLVDEWVVRRDPTIAELTTPMDPRRLRRYDLVEDAISGMEWWACFRSEKPAPSGTASLRRVGRNDPCPCGSGKKLKRCCLP